MKIIVLLLTIFTLVACAPTIKYEKQPFSAPLKAEIYKMPADPFTGIPLPEPIYLKKDITEGKYVVCKKEQAEIAAYTFKDLNNLTIRIVYYRDLNKTMEGMVNLHIQRENLMIDLIVDQNVLKELLREFNVDLQNKITSDKTWFNVEKGGYIAIIIGMLIEMGILIAH